MGHETPFSTTCLVKQMFTSLVGGWKGGLMPHTDSTLTLPPMSCQCSGSAVCIDKLNFLSQNLSESNISRISSWYTNKRMLSWINQNTYKNELFIQHHVFWKLCLLRFYAGVTTFAHYPFAPRFTAINKPRHLRYVFICTQKYQFFIKCKN